MRGGAEAVFFLFAARLLTYLDLENTQPIIGAWASGGQVVGE